MYSNCWCIFLTVHMLDQIRSTQSCLVWKSSFSNMITMIYDVFCWYIHGKTCDRQHWTSKTVSLGVKQINCLKCLESAWWIKDRNARFECYFRCWHISSILSVGYKFTPSNRTFHNVSCGFVSCRHSSYLWTNNAPCIHEPKPMDIRYLSWVPSWELTYSFPTQFWGDDFSFPFWWDMDLFLGGYTISISI